MQSVNIVEWLDAKVSLDGEPSDLPIMTSIGRIIHKDKTITIICSLFGDGVHPRILTHIPTVLIKKVRTIKLTK